MAIGRYGPLPANAGGGQSYTETQTTGPTSSTSNTQGGSSSSSSYNKSWQEIINESSNTRDTTKQTTTSKNMDDEAYGMLMKYLREQMQGGSPEDQRRRQEIWNEIAANQTQRAQYSKGAAFADSSAAASAMMSQALENALPAITAGVDSAGTSGSAMAALLSTKAAEAVSRNAAQLQLEAAINYGQIANQSSGIIAELLKINSEESRSLLHGLEIAKGARTEQTTITDRSISSNSTSNRRGNESGSSQSNESNWSNTTQTNSGGTTSTTRQYHPPAGGTSGGSSGGSSWSTPSSYRFGN